MKIGGNSNAPALTQFQENQKKIFQQLASGLRINQAKDDAAGLQIANRLTSEVNGLNMAMRNANDGISYAQVAEGALSSVGDAVGRIEELSIRAANGSLSASDRKAIQQEISHLQEHVGDVYKNTRFGDQQIFSGGSLSFQVGAQSGQTVDLAVGGEGVSALQSIDVSTAAGAQEAIEIAQAARDEVSSSRANLGAFQNRLGSTINNLSQTAINTEEARSRIQDTDYARATSELVNQQIQDQSAIAMQAQANANQGQILGLLDF
ncbi:flagellin N-terminal helical domain-containing protein [Flocculibacter collagenilyticus]|uniref:flagellin N-terminal helical domain-containing protein n=1 Tax=Flocculibacter collagenilyticus TaxID=2744479 RepID=UPI0018F6BC97|nr:flagellin [Flocculibacter collagenilyticus]